MILLYQAAVIVAPIFAQPDPPDVPTDSVRSLLAWTVGVLILTVIALVRYIVTEQEKCREREKAYREREDQILRTVLKNQQDTNRSIASLNERHAYAEQLEQALDRLEGGR